MNIKKNKQYKIKIALIFGGKSVEHEVSLQSARNVLRAINNQKYKVLPIGIDKNGRWFSFSAREVLSGKPLFFQKNAVSVVPYTREKNFFLLKNGKVSEKIDAVFPLIHGPFGEDGTLQGLLKLFNVPFVGADVIGSAIGMDKDVSKRLLKEAGVSVARFLVYRSNQKNNISFEEIKKTFPSPFFIKPASLGSSVGVSKVRSKKEFISAFKSALTYDKKILVEECVSGREIECAVLGNEKPIASLPGEIIPSHDFYSYNAKYIDKNGAKLIIPAKLPKSMIKKIQALAIKTFETLCCEGMGRVDFFIDKDNRIFVNEINTIPGFTSISMYPKLWEHDGIVYSKLIDALIKLAFDRFDKEKKLKTSFSG